MDNCVVSIDAKGFSCIDPAGVDYRLPFDASLGLVCFPIEQLKIHEESCEGLY